MNIIKINKCHQCININTIANDLRLTTWEPGLEGSGSSTSLFSELQ